MLTDWKRLEKWKGVLHMSDLLKRLHDTQEGETICLNYEDVQEVLLMEQIIEDQEKTIEEAYEKGFTNGQNNMLEAQAEGL